MKVLDKNCIERARLVEKKQLASSKRRFAHLLLWICSGLSTSDQALATYVGDHCAFSQG